jgi:hypothetical protein
VPLATDPRRSVRIATLARTHEELRSRGVGFPQPPVEQSFAWWSMLQDQEGNRFALRPRE